MNTNRERLTNDDVDYDSDLQRATHIGLIRVRRLEDKRIEVTDQEDGSTLVCKDIRELNKLIHWTLE